MTTFSLAQTGIRADATPSPVADYTLPDAMVPTAGVTITTATLGGMLGAMSSNLPLLCKGPDGALGLYTLDAERSTPTVPVLKAMFP